MIIHFNNTKQMKIFFLLLNTDFGLTRKSIVETLLIPRTTVYDNLAILMRKGLVKYYTKNTSNRKVGRPIVYFYIDSKIKQEFLKNQIPKIKLNSN